MKLLTKAPIEAVLAAMRGIRHPAANPNISYLYNPANTRGGTELPSGGPPKPGSKIVPCAGEPGDVITISGTNFGAQQAQQGFYLTLVDAAGNLYGGMSLAAGSEPAKWAGQLDLAGTATPPDLTSPKQLPDGGIYYEPGTPVQLPGNWSDTLLAFAVPDFDAEGNAYVTVTANGSASNKESLMLSFGA